MKKTTTTKETNNKRKKQQLYYLVYSPAVEVCCLLPIELTAYRATVLSGTKSLEAVIDQLGILFMEVFMGHNIRGAGVHLAAAHLQAEAKHGY